MKLLLLILVSTGLSSAAPAKDEAALIKQRYVTYLHGHGSREGMTFHFVKNVEEVLERVFEAGLLKKEEPAPAQANRRSAREARPS